MSFGRSLPEQRLMRPQAIVELGTKLGKAETQGARPVAQLQHVEPACSPFDLADIGLPEADGLRNGALRESLTLPRFAQERQEHDELRACEGAWHASRICDAHHACDPRLCELRLE